MMLLLCAGCDGPILDRFLLTVLDRHWHVKCVQCSECRCPLADKCFSRDGQLFCRDDFFRRFGTKCGGCGQGILPNDLVRRARQNVYHIRCFMCSVCHKQLSTGEQLYVVDDNQFLCKDDFIASKLHAGFNEVVGVSDGDIVTDKLVADETLSERDDYSPCIGGISQPPPCFNNNDDSSPRDTTVLPPLARTLTGNGFFGGRGVVAHPSLDNGGWRNTPGKPDAVCGIGVGGNDVIVKTERHSGIGIDECSFDSTSSCGDDTGSVRSPESNNNNNNGEKLAGGKDKLSGAVSDGGGSSTGGGPGDGQVSGGAGGGTKRRGPRTTIKAKQLETLKSAFAATPKPTRHIREQLAQETGLNMRVIQVWFQNRRSKERRMKQLSAMGARRQFFRNPRRLRALRPGEEFGPDALDLLGPAALGYFTDSCEFYAGYPGNGGFADYFPQMHHGVPEHPGLGFLSPPTPSVPTHHVAGQLHDGVFLPGDIVMHSNAPPQSHPPVVQPQPPLPIQQQAVQQQLVTSSPPLLEHQLPVSGPPKSSSDVSGVGVSQYVTAAASVSAATAAAVGLGQGSSLASAAAAAAANEQQAFYGHHADISIDAW